MTARNLSVRPAVMQTPGTVVPFALPRQDSAVTAQVGQETLPSREPNLERAASDRLLGLLTDNHPPIIPPVDYELAYRQACWDFLAACFHGAPRKRINTLAHALDSARQAMGAAGQWIKR